MITMCPNTGNYKLSKEAKSFLSYMGDGMSSLYSYFKKQQQLKRLAYNQLTNKQLTGGLEEALKPVNRRFYVDQLVRKKIWRFYRCR